MWTHGPSEQPRKPLRSSRPADASRPRYWWPPPLEALPGPPPAAVPTALARDHEAEAFSAQMHILLGMDATAPAHADPMGPPHVVRARRFRRASRTRRRERSSTTALRP